LNIQRFLRMTTLEVIMTQTMTFISHNPLRKFLKFLKDLENPNVCPQTNQKVALANERKRPPTATAVIT